MSMQKKASFLQFTLTDISDPEKAYSCKERSAVNGDIVDKLGGLYCLLSMIFYGLNKRSHFKRFSFCSR